MHHQKKKKKKKKVNMKNPSGWIGSEYLYGEKYLKIKD